MCVALLLLGGCAALPPSAAPSGDTPEAACLALFEHVDAATRAARRADGAAARIPGFPWLRTDRLLASFRDEVDDPQRFADWVERLSEQDRAARAVELSNLPTDARVRLDGAWHDATVEHGFAPEVPAALDACRGRLNDGLRADAARGAALREAARVPDDYHTWQRILGLYVITSRIARSRVIALHEELAERFGGRPEAPVHTYRVADPTPPSPPRITGPKRDALGIPLPDPAREAALLARHAPVWAIESRGDFDRPGALVVDAEGKPVVDPARPVEYRWASHTRFAGDVLLQLNYALWFSERPRTGPLDLVGGHLDGVIWRATLRPDGTVLAYDSIHLCGCYYTLFPGADHALAPIAGNAEPVFAPARATQGHRIFIRLESGTHYLVDVSAAPDADPSDPAIRLATEPMDSLRSLAAVGHDRISAYGPSGLIAASRRLERFVLWPMGVPSPGAMRQPGRHPIAFIGRRHFDDPFLFDNLLQPWPAR